MMDNSRKPRILIFIVAYNAEAHIESVLARIPPEVRDRNKYDTEVLIIDDASTDRTVEKSDDFQLRNAHLRLRVFRNPVNQGYGGNQKIGFHYAIQNGFDVVALLHGDGQYAPECLPELLAPVVKGEAKAVLGSRMMVNAGARRGKMPLYKYAGNKLLTAIQNRLLGSNLTEFHSGYRVYSTEALRGIPFQYNSNGFDFDTDILIQLLDTGVPLREVPIPTYYSDEIRRLRGLAHARAIVATTLRSRLQRRAYVYYHPKFDYVKDNSIYTSKLGFASSHQFAVDEVPHGSTVIDIGCGPAIVAAELKKKQCVVYGVDQTIHDRAKRECAHIQQGDLDTCTIEFGEERLDVILMLDIIEHLDSPEEFLLKLRAHFSRFAPKLVLTTGNVGFAVVRASLLLGHFNYGKKGILDMTHKRLSTFSSLKRTLVNAGYTIERISGIPVPYPLVFGKNRFSSFLLRLNKFFIRMSRRLFSYQIAIIARPDPDVNFLLAAATRHAGAQQEASRETKGAPAAASGPPIGQAQTLRAER
jgi:glycosyltransferase involved in cell wall biosynthesis